jgi:hypothetical protein
VGYTRIETVRECVFRGGRPGNVKPRSDRIARMGEGKRGYLEVSDPEATVAFLRNVDSNQSHTVLQPRRRYTS